MTEPEIDVALEDDVSAMVGRVQVLQSAASVLVLIPALTVLLSFQRAILVNSRATSHVTWATVIEVGLVVGILCLGIFVLHAVGLVVAAVALVVGRLAANLYQVAPLRRLRAAGPVGEAGTADLA